MSTIILSSIFGQAGSIFGPIGRIIGSELGALLGAQLDGAMFGQWRQLKEKYQRLCIKFLSKFFIIKLSKECKKQHFCFYFIATKKFKMCLF